MKTMTHEIWEAIKQYVDAEVALAVARIPDSPWPTRDESKALVKKYEEQRDTLANDVQRLIDEQ